MKKELSLIELSKLAWAAFCQHWVQWIGLAAGGIVLMITALAVDFYVPSSAYFVSFLLCLVGAVYTAILHKNGLDAAFGRPLSLLHVTPAVVFASLFFIAISLYNPFPEYSEILFLVVPADFEFLLVLNLILHFCVSYILFRCMFVGMILLEKKVDVLAAFQESFRLTAHHLLLLFFVFMFLAVLLYAAALTVVGYFIALPYTVIMKSVIFKALQKQVSVKSE